MLAQYPFYKKVAMRALTPAQKTRVFLAKDIEQTVLVIMSAVVVLTILILAVGNL